jgi:hypothetical protein
MNELHDFDLLTLTEVAELLHWVTGSLRVSGATSFRIRST